VNCMNNDGKQRRNCTTCNATVMTLWVAHATGRARAGGIREWCRLSSTVGLSLSSCLNYLTFFDVIKRRSGVYRRQPL